VLPRASKRCGCPVVTEPKRSTAAHAARDAKARKSAGDIEVLLK
jgi:hypothetical protein